MGGMTKSHSLPLWSVPDLHVPRLFRRFPTMGWDGAGKMEALRVEREMLCASHLVMDKRALIMTVDDTHVLHHHCQPSRGRLAIFFFFF